MLCLSALSHVCIVFIHPVTSVSKLGIFKLRTRYCSSCSVRAEMTCVITFRFMQQTEYVAIWRHIQDDIFCFWPEQFPCVQYCCFQTPSGSSRPIIRNKSLTILQICNCNMKGIALKTYSITFQVVLNFVNFVIAGKKKTSSSVRTLSYM